MNPTSITAVQTQSRADVSQWVESYTLGCSDDGETFTIVQDNLRNPTSDRVNLSFILRCKRMSF